MLIWAFIVVPIALNCYASIVIVRSQPATSIQKAAQTLIVWLLPILGALLALAIHKPQRAKHELSIGLSNEERFPGLSGSYDTTTHSTDHDIHFP
jgi:hypothetical protein